jgi:prophage regulatory protein
MSGIFVRSKQLSKELNVSRTTLWRMVKKGELPPPITLSANIVGWRKVDIDSWLANKVS